MKLSGSCLCGAIGFSLEGWVSPVQACHAQRCRKATGALFSPEIAASSANFEWSGDVTVLTRYEAPIIHEPPAYKRNFCSRCGSPLPVEIEGAGMVILSAGILDNSADLYVFRHAFVEQKAECCEIHDDAPQFEGMPPPPDFSIILE
jgi:hypothetical protein